MEHYDEWYIEYDDEVGITYVIHRPCLDGNPVDNCSLTTILSQISGHDCF